MRYCTHRWYSRYGKRKIGQPVPPFKGHRHLLSEERQDKELREKRRKDLGFRHYLSPQGEVCLEEGVRQHKEKDNNKKLINKIIFKKTHKH